MSRFYGEIQGNRGEATRMGSTKSGFRAHICGWDIGVTVDLYDHEGHDRAHIRLTSGSNGRFMSEHIISITQKEADEVFAGKAKIDARIVKV